MRVAIVFNSKSGKGKSRHSYLFFVRKLQEFQIPFDVIELRGKQILDKFYTDLLVIGGDGTINFTLNHLEKIEVPITLVAAGSGNDFARFLHGYKSPEQMLQVLLNGKTVAVDAGLCNGEYFINGVGAGFDALVAKKLLHKKILSGHLAYLLAVVQLLFTYKSSAVEIEADELKYKGHMFMLSVANGITYGGGFKVTPVARYDDGWLDAMLVKPISLLKRFRYLPVIEKGAHLDLSFVTYTKVKKIVVRSPNPTPVHLEGEYRESSEYRIEIIPAAFRFKI